MSVYYYARRLTDIKGRKQVFEDYLNGLPHTSKDNKFKLKKLKNVNIEFKEVCFFYEENKLNTKIFLCGRYFEKNKKNDKVNITISLYGTSEKELVVIKKTMKNNENLELNIADIVKKKKWKNNYGWFYIKFEEGSFCNVVFTSEYMNNSIIGNHAF